MNTIGFEQDFMFTAVPFLFTLFFCVFFAIIIFRIIKGMAGLHKNYQSPELAVVAKVVAKRMDVRRHINGTNDSMIDHSSSTWYYVTFEVESGDRMEFLVPDDQYGLLVEGDQGKLVFQGTKFKSFIRE